jgi:5-methyltetrahydropteroyltriglutamate--homocysteine methyltransferase
VSSTAGLPLFPVTVVGSWPRPAGLRHALKQRQAAEIPQAEFEAAADAAVLEVLRVQEEAGVDVVSDGEQRRDNFYSFLADKLEGMQLMDLGEILQYAEDKVYFDRTLRALDAPSFAIKSPTVTGRLRLRSPLAADGAAFLRRHTRKPIKVSLPGPYLLARATWVAGVSDAAYPTREALAADVVAILRDEIARLVAAGVDFVQLDEPVLTDVVFRPAVAVRSFMCAPLAAQETDTTGELAWAVELVNAVVRGARVRTGLHLCRGNWTRDEAVLLSGSYAPLLAALEAMSVDQWVLEFATPRAGDLDVFRGHAGHELGLGVVNPRIASVESADAIAARVREALAYFDASRIWLNPDCGFGTFAERPVTDAGVATAKLRAMTTAAAALRAGAVSAEPSLHAS